MGLFHYQQRASILLFSFPLTNAWKIIKPHLQNQKLCGFSYTTSPLHIPFVPSRNWVLFGLVWEAAEELKQKQKVQLNCIKFCGGRKGLNPLHEKIRNSEPATILTSHFPLFWTMCLVSTPLHAEGHSKPFPRGLDWSVSNCTLKRNMGQDKDKIRPVLWPLNVIKITLI